MSITRQLKAGRISAEDAERYRAEAELAFGQFRYEGSVGEGVERCRAEAELAFGKCGGGAGEGGDRGG